MDGKTITLRVKRQDGPSAPAHWEAFRIPYKANMNVISALMEIQRHPVTVEGRKTTPPFW
jgi:succinate dehydrogenase / fumarate reductase iron-sulfur subunit